MSKSELHEIAKQVANILSGATPVQRPDIDTFDSMAGLISPVGPPHTMAKGPKPGNKAIDEMTSKFLEQITTEFHTDEDQFEAIQMLRYKFTMFWKTKANESYERSTSSTDRARQLDRFVEATMLP